MFSPLTQLRKCVPNSDSLQKLIIFIFFYRDLKSLQRGTVNRKRLCKDAVPDISLNEKRRKLEVPQAN